LAEVEKTEAGEARTKRIEPAGAAFQSAFLGEATCGHFEADPIEIFKSGAMIFGEASFLCFGAWAYLRTRIRGSAL